MTADQKLFDREPAAKRLGVSTRWLDRQIKDGKVQAVRLGHRVKLHLDEIERIEREGVA